MIPKKGDPYITPQGQAIISRSAVPDVDISVIGTPKAKKLVADARRSIKDLPADPHTTTAMLVVLGYSIIGMSDNEISHMIGHEIDQIHKLKDMPAYQELFEMMFNEMLSVNSNSMTAKIAAYAPKALENMIDLADSAEHEMAKFRANENLLDRAGLHHETLHGKNSTDDGFESLKIVITDDADKQTGINIDLRRKS